MYFPMLIIATMSGREKKKDKNNGMKKQKAYMPTRKNLLVSNTLKKLHKDTKDVMCKIAQVDQFLVCC